MAKKAAKKSVKKSTRKAGQRDLVRAKNASFFAKRDAEGQFTEMDEVGRSLRADRTRKAKRSVKSGFGDQGDQPTRTRKRTAKKR